MNVYFENIIGFEDNKLNLGDSRINFVDIMLDIAWTHESTTSAFNREIETIKFIVLH